ncbi:metalloregulator ArsR/SmtB family transcription factor [Roseixanthobacter glucoisosaccharinicivorans]|uniref:metalloregulator ArsR/SmtB family transcription factor n=1 Tax=Roseixanthobacter glucoisosaccharinicivorans TaxID=3119923 RepID=UPI0037272C55
MDVTKLKAEDATRIFDALSQVTRLETWRLLLRYVPYGLPAGDIARLLAVPHNTLSTHLAVLERAGLVTTRRDGRSILYAVDLSAAGPALSQLMSEMGFAVAPRRTPLTAAFPQLRPDAANDRAYNVLLVCSANSARSLIAEALLNRDGRGRFRAYSAGSRPKRKPHPMALDLLDSLGYDTASLASKSWDGFAGPDAPQMDFIITTCDAAAGEACPTFPGHPLHAHWGLPDPILVKGTEAEQKAAFLATYRRLAGRISAFVNLPFEQLDLASLKERIAEIGRMEGATDFTLSGQAA